MTELRVGIAGLGRLGRVHAANLAHKIPGAGPDGGLRARRGQSGVCPSGIGT